MTRPVRTEGDAAAGARHRPPPPTPGEIEKKTRRSDDDARGGGMTFAAAPSISPREATALRRHSRGARGLRVGDDDGIAPPAAEDRGSPGRSRRLQREAQAGLLTLSMATVSARSAWWLAIRPATLTASAAPVRGGEGQSLDPPPPPFDRSRRRPLRGRRGHTKNTSYGA